MLCGKCGLQIADDAVFCIGCGTYKHPQTDNKNPDDIILSAIKNNEPDIIISAYDLGKELDNEFAFRKKFLNKLIQLSGHVNHIVEGKYNKGYVSINLGDYNTIYAFIIPETSKSIFELKGGDNITLRGFCVLFTQEDFKKIRMNLCKRDIDSSYLAEEIGCNRLNIHIKPCMILKDILILLCQLTSKLLNCT